VFSCAEQYNPNSNFFADAYDESHDLRLKLNSRLVAKVKARFAGYLLLKGREGQMIHALKARYALFSKRTEEVQTICSCLDTVTACVQTNSCSDSVHAVLCSWSSGKMFFGCLDCDNGQMKQYQTPSQIIDGLEKLKPAVIEFIKTHEPLISDLSFEYDFTTGSLMASITPADGVQDPTLAINGMVFYLHQVFDVFPGTFSYQLEVTQKRAVYMVKIDVNDEARVAEMYTTESSGSSLFAGAPAIIFALYTLF
jgi:hypothetical protein